MVDQIAALLRLDRVVREAQAVLRDHLLSGGGMNAEDAVRKLRDVLEDEEFLRFQRSLEGMPEPGDDGPRGPEDPLPYR
jgi:hypothetical protein